MIFMKKNTTIIIMISLITIIVICIIGNIITVADKIGELNPWLGYIFYGILLGLTGVFIIWPTLKIIFTQELEPTGESMSNEEIENAEQMVKKSAQNVFVLTTVSQNGALDTFTCLSMNISMINRLVEIRGKRPSFGQILRLYGAVASSSVLIASADEVMDDVNLGELLGMSGIKATGVLLKSLTNGMLNSLVTMRVGMTTLRYLEIGSLEFNQNKNSIRKEIRRKAVARMPAVVTMGIKNSIIGIKKIF